MKKIYFGLLLLLASFGAKAQFPAPYCTEAFPSGVEPISSVKFGSINNVSSAATTGAVALENFTTLSTTVYPGATYGIEVKGNTDGSFDDGIAIYIDFNNNGLFTDAGESFAVGSITNSTGTDAVFAANFITIPSTAPAGSKRMRVIKLYGAFPAPCNVTGYGQAEDYTVTVAALPLPCAVPSNINFNNVTTTSAGITWTAASGVSAYEYAINSSIVPPTSGTATTTTSGTVNSFNITNQLYGHVRSACGNNSFSPWVSKLFNDSCGAAILLGNSGITVNGTNVSATQSLPAVACNGATSASALDVWYRFTAASNGNATIALTKPAATLDAILVGYSGTCGSLTSIACADAGIDGDDETLSLTNLVVGQTYYIRVYGWAGSIGNFTLTLSGTSLPVTGVNLTAVRANKEVQLAWKTETETNNAGFQVQRSADGKEFTSILSVASKATNGNSTSAINYNAEDAKPFSGANYYRLKQTDKDGKISYSNVVYLKGGLVNNLTVSAIYPNPTKDVLKAAIQSPAAETITFVITDMTGKIVTRQNALVTSGDNTVNLNVANLASGSYLLKAICANSCETGVQKFTKQ